MWLNFSQWWLQTWKVAVASCGQKKTVEGPGTLLTLHILQQRKIFPKTFMENI